MFTQQNKFEIQYISSIPNSFGGAKKKNSLFIGKKGRYGKRSYGNVWDVEKMSLPHIRRKTGDYARPYGQKEVDTRGCK